MSTKNNEINFADVIGEVTKSVQSNTTVIGNLEFTQVTHNQQRTILSSGYDQVEIPAKVANIYNQFIAENVKVTDDMVSSVEHITLETKIPVLVALRVATLGDTYIDDDTKQVYKFKKITPDMVKSTMSDASIKFDKFEIVLSIPTLAKDTRYNNRLISTLNPFKNKRSIDKYLGQVADMYDQTNIIKYIKTIKMGDVEFDFDARPRQEQEQFINRVGSDIISGIKQYIAESRHFEADALTVTNEETGDTMQVDVNVLFFVNTK